MVPSRWFVSLAMVALLCQLPVSLAVNHLYNADTTEAYDCQIVTLSNSLKAFNTLLGNGNTSAGVTVAMTTAGTPTSTSVCQPLGDPATLTDLSGMIASPGFLDGEYPSDSTCAWHIQGPPGSQVQIQFNNFSLELAQPGPVCSTCDSDKVLVFAGDSMRPDMPAGPFCGDVFPDVFIVDSDEVFIVFHSDESVNALGFELQYSILTGDGDVPTLAPTASPEPSDAAFTWCRVLAPFGLDPPATPYIYNVRLQNVNSIYGSDFGMPGVAFNVVDKDNFDFFLLRFLDALCDPDDCIQSCIQYGYVEGGVVSMSVNDQADCRFVRLVGGPEFRLALQVTETEAKLFVNSYEQLFVASYQQPRPVEHHFPLSSRVGVIVPDGSENLIRYRSSQVHEI